MIKDNYDLIFISDNLFSKISASFFSKKNSNVLLLDRIAKTNPKYKDFNIYNYEMPFLFTDDKAYLNNFFSFVGLKKINSFISQKSPLSIVFGNKRFYFYEQFIKNELNREFKPYSKNILAFLDELRLINSKIPPLWLHDISYPSFNIFSRLKFVSRSSMLFMSYYNKNISYLYDKYKFPNYLALLFNTLIFFASGVKQNNYKIIPAARLISQLLNGANSYIGQKLDIETEVNKILESKIDIRKNISIKEFKKNILNYRLRLSSFEGYVKSKYIISDQVNNTYNKLKTFTLNIYIQNDYIPQSIGEFTLYIKTDKSNWFNIEDIYVLRVVRNNTYGTLVLTSFLKNSKIDYEKKYLKMYSDIQELIPFLDKVKIDVFPDFFNNNISESNIIPSNNFIFNDDVKMLNIKKGNFFRCGRDIMPDYGYEGSFISSLKTSDYLIRRFS